MRTKNLKENGITLITLIVTIIILLILAGVSISIVVGDNGILNQAVNGADRTNIARELEVLRLAVSGSLNEDLSINGDGLRINIENALGNNDFEFTDNEDGSYKVKINSSDRLYYIEENGNIISEENMIEINSVEELKTFRDEVNSGNTYDGYYIYLTSDITLDINEEWEPIGYYPMENSTPDAETNRPFCGVFDGNGHEVDGIYINTTDKVQGLFGLVNNGKIMNLGIGENCNIKGGLSIGVVAGFLHNGSKATNCYNKSNLNVGAFSGGVFGQVSRNSIVKNCYNSGNINATSDSERVGGISGNLSSNSSIERSYNIGNINGNSIVGGISGNLSGSAFINECFNAGEVIGNENVGGILGQAMQSCKIQNCYNKGYIRGDFRVGGIIGVNMNKSSD